MAVCVAYLLAIQGLMASVGLGMSPNAARDRSGLVLCSSAANQTANAPAQKDDRQNPSPIPRCPFCFVAAQSAGYVATTGEVPSFPAYAGLPIVAVSHLLVDGTFVPQVRHRHGAPRAPPAFSV